MSETIEVLTPTYDDGPDREPLRRAVRPGSLNGAVVGIISNGKQGTRPFFDAIEAELRSSHGVAEVVRVTKANYSAPADAPIIDRAEEWNALISGIGD